MKEVVGALIIESGKEIVTNSISSIRSAVETHRVKRLLSRQEMLFMAACDLGQNWKDMSESPTLFRINDDGLLSTPYKNGDSHAGR